MSLRPSAYAAPHTPAWRGGAETGALVTAPASRLHLVLAAGQRSAETSGKAELKKKADELGELFQEHAKAQSANAKNAVEAQIKKHFEGKTNKEIVKTLIALTAKGGLRLTEGALSILATILKVSVNVLACLAEHSGDLFQCTDQFKSKKKKTKDSKDSDKKK